MQRSACRAGTPPPDFQFSNTEACKSMTNRIERILRLLSQRSGRLRATASAVAMGLLLAVGAGPAAAEDAAGGDAEKVYALLQERCYSCHGGLEEKIPGLNVLDRVSLLVDRGEDRDRYVNVQSPEDSELLLRVDGGGMPPEDSGQPELSDDEVALVRGWIAAGAKFPVADRAERPFVSDGDILHAIFLHNANARRADRPFLRYFTFANLHNNRSVPDDQLRLFKAALAKAVNSMSRRSGIVQPELVDPTDLVSYPDRRRGQATVYAVDLRDLGWEDLDAWGQVVAAYPYGLKPQESEAFDKYGDLENTYGVDFDGVPYIRADWFVATATRPPLYHGLTEIPQTLDELLQRSGIVVADNIDAGRARRAGMFESGVSGQNRLVEAHPTSSGEFWLSYDFERDNGRSNLARFPLGPGFEGDERFDDFKQFAFEHAGGEIIFNLPNRLHGYMLVDGEGERIDAGPISIVWDANQTSGTPEIVNGVSCMACHKHGMIDFRDEIRSGHALRQNREASRRVEDLYPEQSEMQGLLDDSRRDYLEALAKVVRPFLDLPENAGREAVSAGVRKLPEPVSALARFYDKPLDLETAACELGFENPEDLKQSLSNNTLLRLGLDPLTKSSDIAENGRRLAGKIKRSFWDSREGGTSIFQQAAVELNRGSPVNP